MNNINRITTALLTALSATAYAQPQEPSQDHSHDHEVMVVTASAHNQSVDLAPATIEVLDQKDIELSAYQDLTSVLGNMSGVQISDLGIGNKGISIRGLDSSQTLILINGQRASGSDNLINHGNYSLQGIPPGNIERIEVIKGPLSALYGSNALGGVINVITKKPTNEWQSHLNMGMGSLTRSDGDNYNAQLSSSGALIEDKLLLDFTLSHQNFDEVAGRRPNSRSDQAANETNNMQARLHYYANEEHAFNFGFEGSQVRTGQLVVPGGNDVWMENEADEYRVSVGHEGFFAWGSSEIKAYHNNFSQKNIRDDGQNSNPHDLEETVVDGFVRTQVGNHDLVFGGTYMHQKLTTAGFTDSNHETANQGALFAQDEIALTSTVDLLLGVRMDHHEAFGSHVTPRAYVVYNPTQRWIIKGGYGEGFSAPNLTQMSDNYFNSDPGHPNDVRGNGDLKPEENAALELSVNYDADVWGVGLTAFHNNLTNLIDLKCIERCDGTDRPVQQYHNVDKARLQGIEANAHWQILSTLHLDANTTFLDAEDRTTNQRLEERPRWMANATVRWNANERWEVVPRWRYIGEQERNGNTLPDYSVVDLTTNVQIDSQWRVNFGVSNVFDVYLPDESENFVNYFVESGRRVFVNATMSF
ncbi:TonB-dependent receptor [Vibrio sp. FNV 38]|nr:TonB-dependent receptor [Vibrio sp. FNV 38]